MVMSAPESASPASPGWTRPNFSAVVLSRLSFDIRRACNLRSFAMKIRELAQQWPPGVANAAGDSIFAEPTDEVLSADRYELGKDHIRVRLRKRNGTEYSVVLTLPDHLYGNALIAIALAKKITLSELGELDV
jgi:hypothetical protein